MGEEIKFSCLRLRLRAFLVQSWPPRPLGPGGKAELVPPFSRGFAKLGSVPGTESWVGVVGASSPVSNSLPPSHLFTGGTTVWPK